MPSDPWDILDLPSDPALLTRELARMAFAHPEHLEAAYARLATPAHHTTAPALVPEKAHLNDA